MYLITGVYHACPPNYVEKDGICKEEDLCKDGTLCKEDETCIRLSIKYTCLRTICPVGYRKVKKRCVKDCSKQICESGAKYSESQEQIHVKIEGPIAFSRKLYYLTTDRSNTTYYRIKENEAGKPFKVKLEDGFAKLYAVANLPPRGPVPYRVIVVASTYDKTDSTILYINEYIVNVYVVD
ncbi:Uncharacterized protein GBIM_12147 [Gryllus bimaculatus]|nr:Uncharacterized protein GBIM_12147 [Gryllus bimaculatus]